LKAPPHAARDRRSTRACRSADESTELIHFVLILFLFALGASVGSFINVVVWRLPRIEAPPTTPLWRWWLIQIRGLCTPPSHCPRCDHPLAWFDNIPVIGWLCLRGRCRYCREPISARYPIVEALMGALFVFYYVMFFLAQVGPCAAQPAVSVDALGIVTSPGMSFGADWPIYLLYMVLLHCARPASSMRSCTSSRRRSRG
jgi:leader peptidase (prepilin peptidase)/N-methyltransferase